MSRYPDWVNEYKEKGTSIKKVGNSYYLYKSTSVRVPGKKYPQPIQKFLGTITMDGLVLSKVRKISTEKVRVYEYGFSYALRALMQEKFLLDIKDPEKRNQIFLNIVRHYSPSSYLLRDIELLTMAELHSSLGMQIKKWERLSGIRIETLLPLSGLYLIEAKECDMLSYASPKITEQMESLGVGHYDL